MACVGHASLDHVFEIDAFPAEPTKTLAHRFSARAGGMSLHASIACARLGARARLLSRVGDDEAATFLRRRLIEEGVQADGMQRVPGATTSLAAVIVDAGGTRQIFIHRGNALERAHPLDVRQLEGAELVLADPRWPEGAAAALRWARDHDVPALLDADVAPLPVLDRLVPLARWVAFSEAGLAVWARGATRDGALSRSVALGPSLGLVTLGPQGARWAEAGSDAMGDVAAPAVDALDTTGAGDVFHAALGLALAEGRAVPDAVAWACAAAAFKCERGGGVEGAPTRAELGAWQRQRRER
ncbi:MAG: PfkB family carbohydrate kinase [Aquincola sp.]|nr:PfkB family carbohydrate kinase [Aquincola sp.]